jgi:hypothetical protein
MIVMKIRADRLVPREIKINYPKSDGPVLPVILKAVLGLNEDEVTRLYFRGEHKKYDYMIPSFYRDGNETLVYEGSEKYYRFLMSELGRDDCTDSTSLIRLMAEFRHYEAATRILDVSKNLLTAVYFAVEYSKDTKDEPGYIYIFSAHKTLSLYTLIKNKEMYKEEFFDTSLTIAIKAALNLINQNFINSFLSSCSSLEGLFDICNADSEMSEGDYYSYRQYMLSKNLTDLKEYFKKIVMSCKEVDESDKHNLIGYFSFIETFMELLNQKISIRGELDNPFEIRDIIQTTQLFIPSMNTDRIQRQRGAFLFPPYVDTQDMKAADKGYRRDMDSIRAEIQQSIYKYLYPGKKGNTIIIPSDLKPKLRKELAMVGIDGGYLYSDIKHNSDTLLSELNHSDG